MRLQCIDYPIVCLNRDGRAKQLRRIEHYPGNGIGPEHRAIRCAQRVYSTLTWTVGTAEIDDSMSEQSIGRRNIDGIVPEYCTASCALPGTIASVESYLYRELRVNGSVFLGSVAI